jgi:hypothetical protein
MKKIFIALMIVMLAGCQTSDQEIRADISVKAQQDLNFSALDYTVQGGVVDINGRCPSEKALAKIRQTIANINVIKAVHYHVSIAPVILDTLTQIKLQADSLLTQYPEVTAHVYPAGVTLTGKVAASEKEQLLRAFRRPHMRIVKDSVSIY